MKKLVMFLAALVIVLALAGFFLLQWGKKENQQDKNLTFTEISAVKGNELKDSVFVCLTCATDGNPRLVSAINECISEKLGGTYTGSYLDAQAMVNHYAQQRMQRQADDRKEFEDQPEDLQYYNNIHGHVIHVTDKLITFQITEEGYSGGAHGWFTVDGMTLRSSDGRKLVMEDIMLSPSRYAPDEDWAKMMNDDLKKCLDVEGKSDDELMDVLQLMNPEMGIPLPETEPYFTKDGLFFPYQQYEICSYAQGMPSFTIPYDKLGKYLNTTGKNLIK